MGAARTAESSATPTRALTCGGTVHLPPKQPNAQPIAWYGATLDQARAVKWTCGACHETEYELCRLGARWFIRRRRGTSVYETVRDTRAEAEHLWSLLVAGAVR
jgi:hypothetical protein